MIEAIVLTADKQIDAAKMVQMIAADHVNLSNKLNDVRFVYYGSIITILIMIKKLLIEVLDKGTTIRSPSLKRAGNWLLLTPYLTGALESC